MKNEYRGFIQKNDDGSENINYNNDDFPVYLHKGCILPDSTWANVAHYHEDVEIITVHEGKMGYNINGQNVYLKEGDTLFINAGQIHYSFATQEEICYYLIGILHPKLLCSSYSIEEEFVTPITQNVQIPFLYFKAGEFTCLALRNSLYQMYKVFPNTLLVMKEFYETWDYIFSYCKDMINRDSFSQSDTALACMKNMMHFCRMHYASPISLQDIACAGGVSNTYCNQLFHRYTNRTPIESLLRFRTEKAAELLTSSSLTMSEIAERCGFSGASYFAEIFKRYYNVSPREYRKSKK